MKNLKKPQISRFKPLFLFGCIITPLLLLSCACGKSAQNNSYQHTSTRSDCLYASENARIDRYAKDSIYIQDSIQVLMKGDTVYTDRWHTRLVYKALNVLQADTVYRYSDRIVTDTVTASKTEYKWKDKPLPAWRKALELVGGLCSIIMLYILIVAFKTNRK